MPGTVILEAGLKKVSSELNGDRREKRSGGAGGEQ
jgi:hypothetical protein